MKKIISLILGFLFMFPFIEMLIPSVFGSYASQQCSSGQKTWANAPFEMQYVPQGIRTAEEFNLAHAGVNFAVGGGLGFAGATAVCVLATGGMCVVPALIVGGVVAVSSLITGYFTPTWKETTKINFNGIEYTTDELQSVNFSKITTMIPDQISCGWHFACELGIPDIAYTRQNVPIWTNTPVLHYGFLSVEDQYGTARQGWVIPADNNGFRDPEGLAVRDSFRVFEEMRNFQGQLVGRRAVPFDMVVLKDNGNSTFVNDANLYFTISEQSPFSQTSYLVEYSLNENDPYGLVNPAMHGYKTELSGYERRIFNVTMNPYLNTTENVWLHFYFKSYCDSVQTGGALNFLIRDSENYSYNETGCMVIDRGWCGGVQTWKYTVSRNPLTKNWAGRKADIFLTTIRDTYTSCPNDNNYGNTWRLTDGYFNLGLDTADYVGTGSYATTIGGIPVTYQWWGSQYSREYNTHNIWNDYDIPSADITIQDPTGTDTTYLYNTLMFGYDCQHNGNYVYCPPIASSPSSTEEARKLEYPSDYFYTSNENRTGWVSVENFDGKNVYYQKINKTNVVKTMYVWKGQPFIDIVIDQTQSNVSYNFLMSGVYNSSNTRIHPDIPVLIYDIDNTRKIVIPFNTSENLKAPRLVVRLYAFPSGTSDTAILNRIYLDFSQPLYFTQCGTIQTEYLQLTDIPILDLVSENNTVNMTEFKQYIPFEQFVSTTTTIGGYNPPYNYTTNWFKPLLNTSALGENYQFISAFITPFFLATVLMIFLSAFAGVGFGMASGGSFDGRAFGLSMLLLTLIYTVLGIYPAWVGIAFIILGGFLVARAVVMALGG